MAKKGKTPRRRGRGEPGARTRLSKMVTRRMKDAQALVSSIRAHKARVAAAYRKRLEPALQPGESLPDHELHLELLARSVETAIDRLVALDDRHDGARARRALLAREVDRVAKEELYPQAVAVRRAIVTALGREVGATLHAFSGKTPRVALTLKLLVQRTLLALADPQRELPPPKTPGEAVDREGWIRRLEAPYLELLEIDRELARSSRRLGRVRLDREQAMKDYDALYSETLRYVEEELRMAGIGDPILKNLRPYYRRRQLRRRARKKRETRAARAEAAARLAAESREPDAEDRDAEPAEGRPPAVESREPQAPGSGEAEEEEGRPSRGAVATVSQWLRRNRG